MNIPTLSCAVGLLILAAGTLEAQTLKVAKYVQSVLTREHPGAEVHLYSLSGNPLPLCDPSTGICRKP